MVEPGQRGDCSRRVRRGGSWANGPVHVLSTVRYGSDRSARGSLLGLRLAQDD